MANVIDGADFNRVVADVQQLIADGRGDEAVSMVESCSGTDSLLLQLRAVTYSSMRHDREALLKSVELWRLVRPDEHPEVAFQLAAALQAVVELTARTDGKITVIENDRDLIRTARLSYLEAADHADSGVRLKLVALVNAGNLFDLMGREVDALRCYDRALDIDPAFGMALGNRAMTLVRIAPFMGDHQSHVLEEAAWLLEHSFRDEQRIVETGGISALETFKRQRAAIRGADEPEAPNSSSPRFSDPHVQWSYNHGLLLHISPACLADDATSVDPLHLGTTVWSIKEDELQRLKDLRDAFNTVKQEFLSARYSLWLATDPQSPIREHTASVSRLGYFADTLCYARWGIRTGMALQALTAATNTLDKIAGLTHLYFRTGANPKKVSFNQLWHTRPVKDEPLKMDPVLAEELRLTDNSGLAAIIDLSCDASTNEHQTPLKQQVARRHAATHRFLVAHDLPMYEQDETKWLTRLDWNDLFEGTIEQLRVTRAALIYLARAIAVREDARNTDGDVTPSLPSYAVEDFDTESW